ncbi:MAG: hypothetical protein JSS87_04595 [Acidobacteria bacterium]|nr:hypothetical protein [Acidobacteriota bacterium]
MTSDFLYRLDTSPRALVKLLPQVVRPPADVALQHIQSGTFQRSMSLLVMGTSAVSGLEVAYEHYRGSYSNPIMYTPVILSGVLSIAGAAAFFSRRMARTFLRYTSFLTVVDGLIGFGFHIRGVQRKPGGWRLPITNIVMGPPIFAPLLFGTSAYLGILASYLQREEDFGQQKIKLESAGNGLHKTDWREDIRTGRFQKHLCVVTAVGTLCSGGEAFYSHYKDNFKYRVQWSPLIVTPLLAGAALGAFASETCANTLLPLAAGAAILNGVAGTFYHVRGILSRPGGKKKPLYNTLYGPPIFAPLLFSAAGMLGMLAYLMRRERR